MNKESKHTLSPRQEFVMRRQKTVNSLIIIGESAMARDFLAANEKCSFEYLEHSLRQLLKRAIDEPFRAQTLASAIHEAQMLPALAEVEGK